MHRVQYKKKKTKKKHASFCFFFFLVMFSISRRQIQPHSVTRRDSRGVASKAEQLPDGSGSILLNK